MSVVVAPKSGSPGTLGKGAARRGRRAALVVLVVIAAAFIASSTWQLAAQVFAAPVTYPVSEACAAALRAFMASVDDRRAAEVPEPVMSAVEAACTDGKDYEALVAARRLRDAARSRSADDRAALARFRRAVDMRLSP
jgi:hypothetical protein